MRISRVRIENFRNFRLVDVKLGGHAVVVGENKVGKSNFLHALRLVLDPTLPDSARQLRTEDFWDGIPRPLPATARICVTVDLADFDDSDEQLASLSDFLVEAEPMVARLTYEFRRAAGRNGDKETSEFEFAVYGGVRQDAWVTWDVRRRVALDLVPALRDAESDLANWRRSPLRPLLAKMVDSIDRATKNEIADDVARATAAILELDEVGQLGRLVAGTLASLVGDAQAADVQLGLVPTDADRILRSLRVLIDGGARGVGEASLGVANTLYLTLKLLEIQQLTSEGARGHTFLAIEEPEAHLHPHVQRNVFSSILRGRAHLPEREGGLAPASSTILLTTHSPHVASVAKVRSLVLLRSAASGGSTAVSTADLDVTSIEEEDLERYLDVTRAEILFARGVVLVEGDAETFVVPRIAQFMGLNLDSLGITVCSVGGVNFTPHVKLLKALAIPFAVVTDFDDTDEDGGSLGENRVVALMAHLMPKEIYDPATFEDVLEAAPASGVFLGSATFEIDLLRAGRVWSMCEALKSATTNGKAKERATAWQAAKKVSPDDEDRFLKDIEEIGKGRYAQRLASTMKKAAAGRPNGPKYILDALTYLADQCRLQ